LCCPPGAVDKKTVLSGFAFLDGEAAYICFRGTFNLRNWLSDLHFIPKGRPRRHSGFDNCWRRLQPQVESWLAKHKPVELILTGHSLGGAIAQLAALDLAPKRRIRAVVCFGAPLVGWRRYASTYDATPINGRPGKTLGEITTTYVFKSDLVRFVMLPRLGYKPIGQSMSIDEAGRTGEFYPWFQDALSVTLRAAGAVAGNSPVVTASSQPFYIAPRNVTHPPRLDVRELIQTAQPLVRPLLTFFPHLAAAGLMLAGLSSAVLAAVFFRRDISYHNARARYVGAMTARFSRWLPLAYNEHGENLLSAGNAASAVPYFTAALDLAEADVRNLPEKIRLLSSFPELQRRYTCQYRLNRAEALQATGDYPAAIADLTAVIKSYGTEKVEVSVADDGSFSVSYQVLAVERRAVVFELNNQLPQAMADYSVLIAAKPDFNQGAFFAILDKARRRYGASSSVATVLGYRKTAVDAETDRLLDVRKQVFNAGMAKTFEWAYYRRALCAFHMRDYGAALADATAAIGFNSSDAWIYNLRAGANQALKNFDDALGDFTRSIELEPKVAGFWFARAYALMMNSATLRPTQDGSQMTMVSARVRAADIPLIEADLHRTLELDPSHSLAKAMLQGIAQPRDASSASAG
jgi:tetratricopeptide (TPR) repeat protein